MFVRCHTIVSYEYVYNQEKWNNHKIGTTVASLITNSQLYYRVSFIQFYERLCSLFWLIMALSFVFSCPRSLVCCFHLLSTPSSIQYLLGAFVSVSMLAFVPLRPASSWRFISVFVSAFVPLRLLPGIFLAPSFQFSCRRLFHSVFYPANDCHSKYLPAQSTRSTVLDTCYYYCCVLCQQCYYYCQVCVVCKHSSNVFRNVFNGQKYMHIGTSQ